MSLFSTLLIVIAGFFLVILILVARLLWNKTRQNVDDRYQQLRYEKYSRMIDETVAETPEIDREVKITKQLGDDEVIERILHGKLEQLKGEDRSRVAARIKDIGLTQDYVEKLSSSDPVQRARALEVLGDLRVVDVSGRFIQALRDDDADVRLTAARGLGKMIDEIRLTGQDRDKFQSLIQALVSLLDEPERWPLRRLAEILVGVGSDAIEPLLAEFKSPASEVRALVADIFGGIKDPKVTDTLIAALSDPETDVRARAASALGALGSAKAAKPLIEALKDEAWPVRARAAKSLGKIGDQTAIWPLAELLKDRQWWVRRNAGYALAAFGKDGLEILEKNLANPDPYAAERALEVLEETGRVNELIKTLGSAEADSRTHAIALVVAVGRVGGLAPLIETTKETTNKRIMGSLIEVWRELTEYIAEALASGDKQSEMRAIESTNKIMYSSVMSRLGSLAEHKTKGATTSLAEIDKNMAEIKKAMGYLKEDVDPQIRDEAASTLNYMER